MGGETTNFKLPYPVDGDPPDGPTQIKALADKLDALQWPSRALKPTIGVKNATASLTCTKEVKDITGCKLEITPIVASLLKVTAIWQVKSIAKDVTTGRLNVDGVEYEGENDYPMYQVETAETTYGVMVGMWVISLTAEAHTIKMRAFNSAGGNTQIRPDNTKLIYELFAA